MTSLDELADAANFAQLSDPEAGRLSANGLQLKDLFLTQRNAYFHWEDKPEHCVNPSLRIITFSNPYDPSTLRHYFFPSVEVDKIISSRSKVNLDEKNPAVGGLMIQTYLNNRALNITNGTD
jgi:hypothetical protein